MIPNALFFAEPAAKRTLVAVVEQFRESLQMYQGKSRSCCYPHMPHAIFLNTIPFFKGFGTSWTTSTPTRGCLSLRSPHALTRRDASHWAATARFSSHHIMRQRPLTTPTTPNPSLSLPATPNTPCPLSCYPHPHLRPSPPRPQPRHPTPSSPPQPHPVLTPQPYPVLTPSTPSSPLSSPRPHPHRPSPRPMHRLAGTRSAGGGSESDDEAR